MKISTSFDLPQNELEDVVIHEMIHYYIALNNLHDSSTHGETFRSIMTNINSKYGRNVTVRHRGAVPQVVNKQKECQRFFCISTFRDGNIGITVTSAAKVLELHRRIPEFYDIARMEWFSSNDPFFSRFPRSRTPKIYRINREELYKHLSDALPQQFSRT